MRNGTKELRPDPERGEVRDGHGDVRLPVTHSMNPLSLPPAGSFGLTAGGLAPQQSILPSCQ